MTQDTTVGKALTLTAEKALAALRHLQLQYRADPELDNVWWAECPRCGFAGVEDDALTLRLEEVHPDARVRGVCVGDDGCGESISLFYLVGVEEPPTLELVRRRRQIQAQLEIASYLQAIRDLQPVAFGSEAAA
jgi:hypothetical protein